MKPNILLITADQWRGDCLSVVGHPTVRTPHVDALAAEGSLFRRHYAGAAPCSPARASIYTGLYQMNHRVCRNGSPLDARFDNVALAARRAGYDPTLFGYTDVSPDPRRLHPNDPHLTSYEGVLPGFTVGQILIESEKQWLSWLRQRGHTISAERSVHDTGGPGLPDVNTRPPSYQAEETQTAFMTDAFLRWLPEQDTSWFAHISYLRPHPPFCVPEPYNSMYAPGDGPAYHRSPDRAAEMALHPLVAFGMHGMQKADFVAGAKGMVSDWGPADFDRLRAIYFGMITEVDAQFGRIVQALKASRQWDNTLVIFTSDHGEMMGDHWSLGKGGFFDASYHLPLVIKPAGKKAQGRVVEHFTSAADLMPTICDYMGTKPANHIDGASLHAFLSGGSPESWRDAAFWEFDFRDVVNGDQEWAFGLSSAECNMAVIRDADFKYVHFAGLRPLLFDLRSDPSELINRAEDQAYLPIRLAYAEKLLSLRARHLDQTLAFTALTPSGPVSRPTIS